MQQDLMSLPVAILAGGLATRLRPLTERIPKILMDVKGKPFAVYQVELLRQNGFTDMVFCIGYLGEMVMETLGDGRRYGVNIRYVSDWPDLLGTGGALIRALPFLGNAFFVVYGDSYMPCNYAAVEEFFLKSGKSGVMTVFHNMNMWDKSNVLFRDGKILRYDKQSNEPDMQHIDYGVGVFRAEALAHYPSNVPLDLAAVYGDLLDRGQLAAFEVTQRFYEIGSSAGLEETRQYLSSMEE
jgi:NDP-sugar pyrophosphorylase family protein